MIKSIIYENPANNFKKDLKEEIVKKIEEKILNPQSHLDWFLKGTAAGFKKGWGYYQAKKNNLETASPEKVNEWIQEFWDNEKAEEDSEYDKRYREFLEEASVLREQFIYEFLQLVKKKGIKTDNMDIISLILDFMKGNLDVKLNQRRYYDNLKKRNK